MVPPTISGLTPALILLRNNKLPSMTAAIDPSVSAIVVVNYADTLSFIPLVIRIVGGTWGARISVCLLTVYGGYLGVGSALATS